MAFAALDSLHPISHAVANTIKRVVIIVVSVLVFRNPVSACVYVWSGVCDSIELLATRLYQNQKQLSAPAISMPVPLQMSTQSVVGSAMAIVGVFAYSLALEKTKKK